MGIFVRFFRAIPAFLFVAALVSLVIGDLEAFGLNNPWPMLAEFYRNMLYTFAGTFNIELLADLDKVKGDRIFDAAIMLLMYATDYGIAFSQNSNSGDSGKPKVSAGTDTIRRTIGRP